MVLGRDDLVCNCNNRIVLEIRTCGFYLATFERCHECDETFPMFWQVTTYCRRTARRDKGGETVSRGQKQTIFEGKPYTLQESPETSQKKKTRAGETVGSKPQELKPSEASLAKIRKDNRPRQPH